MSRKHKRGASGAGRTVLACAISIAIHIAFFAIVASPFLKTQHPQTVEIFFDKGSLLDGEAAAADLKGRAEPGRPQMAGLPTASVPELGEGARGGRDAAPDRALHPEAQANPKPVPDLAADHEVLGLAPTRAGSSAQTSLGSPPSADIEGADGASPGDPIPAGPSFAARILPERILAARILAARILAARILAARILAEVEARKSYPESARRRGTEGTARVRLRIAANGNLEAASIAASSGSPLLDTSALSLASSIFPMDNPAMLELDLVIAVRYALRKQP